MRVPSSSWEQEPIKILHTRFDRFPRTADLRRLYDAAREASGLPQAADKEGRQVAFAKWVNSLIKRGYLMRLQKDLYANISSTTYPDSLEVAHLLRPTAVVSLQSVLGSSGTRNNPSAYTFGIILTESPDGTRPRDVQLTLQSRDGGGRPWNYRFVGMNSKLYYAGKDEDRLDPNFSYPRATVERAFCDMVAANAHPRMRIKSNWAFEADFSDLDMDRVGRLVEAMDIKDAYDAFMAQVPDEEPEPYSSSMSL